MHHGCCISKSLLFQLAFVLVVAQQSTAQTVIREEFNLDKSSSTTRTNTVLNEGSCAIPPSSGYTSFYFTMGGRVVIYANGPGYLDFGQTVTLTSSLGVVFDGSVSDFYNQSFPVGTVSPGDRLSFTIQFQDPYASTINGQNPEVSGSYGTLGVQSMGGGYIWHGFDTRYKSQQYTYSISVLLYADLSTVRDLRSPAGPPREPCPVIAPISGDIVAQYIPNGYAGDLPKFRSKSDSFSVTPDLQWSQLNFGHVDAGDTLVYSLISGSPDLLGQHVYPRWAANPWAWNVLFWYMEYEDWIDNDFLDYFTYTWVTPAKYAVTFDKPNASPGDTVRLFIDPIGFSENPSEPMDLNITEGRVISVLQDTLGTFSAMDINGRAFSHVRKELRLVISSPAAPPVMAKVADAGTSTQATSDPTRIIVQVFDDNDNTKTGRGVISLQKKKQLKIVDHSPWEIWPDLVNKQSKSTAKGYNLKRFFTLNVVDESKKPIAGESVEIICKLTELTGGHHHNVPVLEQTRQGKFYAQNKKGNPLKDLITDEYGRVSIDSLVASEVSGEYLVTARLATDTTVLDTVQLKVKVPGLRPLQSGSSNLITYTSPEAGRVHRLDDSDYGDSSAIAVIQSCVKQYAEEYGMESDVFLAAIDMSLPSGGLFDIKGHWQTPHQLHRTGKSVDFSAFYRDSVGNTIKVEIYIDGVLRKTTDRIDQDFLDKKFDALRFSRKEKPDLIHYESER